MYILSGAAILTFVLIQADFRQGENCGLSGIERDLVGNQRF
jgi:hypothetical protein